MVHLTHFSRLLSVSPGETCFILPTWILHFYQSSPTVFWEAVPNMTNLFGCQHINYLLLDFTHLNSWWYNVGWQWPEAEWTHWFCKLRNIFFFSKATLAVGYHRWSPWLITDFSFKKVDYCLSSDRVFIEANPKAWVRRLWTCHGEITRFAALLWLACSLHPSRLCFNEKTQHEHF